MKCNLVFHCVVNVSVLKKIIRKLKKAKFWILAIITPTAKFWCLFRVLHVGFFRTVNRSHDFLFPHPIFLQLRFKSLPVLHLFKKLNKKNQYPELLPCSQMCPRLSKPARSPHALPNLAFMGSIHRLNGLKKASLSRVPGHLGQAHCFSFFVQYGGAGWSNTEHSKGRAAWGLKGWDNHPAKSQDQTSGITTQPTTGTGRPR